jgi:hypothetical protein
VLPLPQHCTLPAHEEATLPLSLSSLPWPLPLQSPLPSPLLLPTLLPSPSLLPLPIAFAVGHCHCGLRKPLPPPSLLRHCQPLPSPLPLPSAIAVSITQPSQLPSLLAITVTVAVGHFRELLPWHGKNCI